MKRAPGAAQLVAQSFFLSGLAALVHEVLWARLLALFCGSTSAAVAATTGAVMAGLAAGCALSGRWSRRLPAPSLLSAYAVLEAGVALCSGAGWLLLRAASGVLLGDPARFVAAFAAVLPAATLMGATLPLLTRWSAGSPELSLARLYGVNTTGAVLGCLLCGFVFLPQFGLLRTLALAATFNGCAAFLALMAREEKLGRAPESPGRSRPVPVSLLAAVSLAGAGSLALQAAWTRALCLVLGASVYAFALVLAVFLAGVAGGSLAVHARPRALRASDAFLALAAVSLLGIPLLGEMPYAWARLWSWSSSGPVALHALQALFCLALMGVPTALMGAALPLCAEQAAGGGAPGEDVVGSLWAWNTGGAIVGAVLGGLVFLPALGLLGAIRAGAGLYVLAALASGEPARPAIAGAILAAGLLLPGPDARLLSSGMFVYGPQYQEAKTRRAFLEELRKDRVIFDRDGRSSTVTVLETPQGGRYLRVDGKTDASLSADLDTQLLIGYLPLLLHPGAPRRALVIGFGSGATAAALASAPLERIDIAEIEPAVLEAAPLFRRANRDVLGDPRVRAHAADGRRFLSSSSASYDLVSSEPSNPWIAGVSSLYTREAFEAVRARLEPGGVFLQWFHSYHMSARDFRMILRTFVSVFPHSLLFWNGESDFFLVGSPTPWSIDYPRIQRIMGEARVKEDLAAAKPSFQRPLSLLVSTFLLGEEDLRAASAGAEIQADDLPALEFRAPHSHGRGEGHAILEALLAAKTHPLPPLRNFSPGPRDAAAMRALSGELFLSSGERAKARAAFESALALYPADAVALVGLGRVLEESGERGRAESLYRRARAAEPGRPDGHLQLGLLLVRSGRKAEGIACLERGLALGPPEPAASLELAMQYLEAGRKEDARKVLARALERPVADDLVNENLGLALKIARS